jgi:hypothetical protein
MNRTPAYFDLLEALAAETCPVCQLGLSAVDRYIKAINYESAGDHVMRGQLRAAFGFCNVHAYLWLRNAHLLGTASIYVDVVTHSRNALRTLAFQPATLLDSVTGLLGRPSPHGNAADSLAPHALCLICQHLSETEAMLIRTLLAVLLDPPFQNAYRTSSGLCLPHLRLALGQSNDEATFAFLRDHAVAREERLLAQLREIVRRHDYRYMDEPVGEERGAAERAIQHTVGMLHAPFVPPAAPGPR